MHTKKYWILFYPTVTIGILLLFSLPPEDRAYVFLAPIVFWILYYSWIHMENK